MGRGSSLAPAPPPPLILHVLTLDSARYKELLGAYTCYYYCDWGSSFSTILGFVLSVQEKGGSGV